MLLLTTVVHSEPKLRRPLRDTMESTGKATSRSRCGQSTAVSIKKQLSHLTPAGSSMQVLLSSAPAAKVILPSLGVTTPGLQQVEVIEIFKQRVSITITSSGNSSKPGGMLFPGEAVFMLIMVEGQEMCALLRNWLNQRIILKMEALVVRIVM